MFNFGPNLLQKIQDIPKSFLKNNMVQNDRKRRVPENPWDPSYQFLKILNMGSISFKKHEMDILVGSTQLKESHPPTHRIPIPSPASAPPVGWSDQSQKSGQGDPS